MARPNKLSAQVFLELPPVLAHYLEANRATWLESAPSAGRVAMMNRHGVFTDIESLAVARRQYLELMGHDRARALCFRMGFERGRRDATRHMTQYDGNARLALQAATVFGQLQGRYVAEPVRFEFDLDAGTLYREVALHNSQEAVAHQMVRDDVRGCICWETSGYLSGHVSEILGRAVISLEQSCINAGDSCCRFISRLDAEWSADDAMWARQALRMESVESEIKRRDEMVDTAQRAARSAQTAMASMSRRLKTELLLDNLVMGSEVMGPVEVRARQVAKTVVPVFLVGELGTGRASLARAIHHGGPRRDGPFETVDCRGMNPSTIVQELAGYTPGAFPGALRAYDGLLARAGGGTIYLDEVTALSSDAQGLLFRTIESGTITPLGASQSIPVDVRVIAATQYDPLDKLASMDLREDLYYGLSVGRIDVPPLRTRGDDILRLAQAFLKESADRHEKPTPRMNDEFCRLLRECSWPGNLRQMRNVIEHALLFAQGEELSLADLPEEVIAARWARPPQDLSADVIRAVLKRTRGNRSEAADILGVGRTTLWRAMKRMGID